MRVSLQVPCKTLVLALLAVASTFCAVAAFAAPAEACSLNSHCYGITMWDVNGISGAGFNGAKVDLRTNCMTVDDPTSHFTTNELWVVKSDGSSWMEAGLTTGTPNGTAHKFFRAKQTPGGTYSEAASSASYAYNTYYTTDIHYTSGTTWYVNVGPWGPFNSDPGFSGNAKRIQTGTETSSAASPQSFGSSSSMQYHTLQDSWVSDWNSSGAGIAQIVETGTAYANWVHFYNHIQDGVGPTC